MSKRPNAASLRATGPTPSEADSFQSPLARLLESPNLVRLVPRLAPETLHQLIRHSGLDACGELVAAATPRQLTSVLDLDLWRPAQPGRDDLFDADRFGEWLELLAETGGTIAARIVAALDENLVIAGLSRYVRVFDPSTFAPSASMMTSRWTMDEHAARRPRAPGRRLSGARDQVRCLGCDRALLLALDAGHRDCFHAVMQGCRRLSNSTPEDDGLDNLLMEPEQLLHDVAVEREDRRTQLGYSHAGRGARLSPVGERPRPRTPDGAPSTNPVAAVTFAPSTTLWRQPIGRIHAFRAAT